MKKAILATLAVAAAIAAGVGLRLYEESRPLEVLETSGAPTSFPRLTVQLGRSGNRLIVTNAGDQPWTRCMVDINAGVPGGGFSSEITGVEPGGDVALQLDRFRRTDGRVFDPEAEPIQVVDVHCDTPAGDMHFSGRL